MGCAVEGDGGGGGVWGWGALVQRVVKVVRNKTNKKKKKFRSQFADSFYDCLGRQDLSDSTTRRRIVAADGKWEPYLQIEQNNIYWETL